LVHHLFQGHPRLQQVASCVTHMVHHLLQVHLKQKCTYSIFTILCSCLGAKSPPETKTYSGFCAVYEVRECVTHMVHHLVQIHLRHTRSCFSSCFLQTKSVSGSDLLLLSSIVGCQLCLLCRLAHHLRTERANFIVAAQIEWTATKQQVDSKKTVSKGNPASSR